MANSSGPNSDDPRRPDRSKRKSRPSDAHAGDFDDGTFELGAPEDQDWRASDDHEPTETVDLSERHVDSASPTPSSESAAEDAAAADVEPYATQAFGTEDGGSDAGFDATLPPDADEPQATQDLSRLREQAIEQRSQPDSSIIEVGSSDAAASPEIDDDDVGGATMVGAIDADEPAGTIDFNSSAAGAADSVDDSIDDSIDDFGGATMVGGDDFDDHDSSIDASSIDAEPEATIAGHEIEQVEPDATMNIGSASGPPAEDNTGMATYVTGSTPGGGPGALASSPSDTAQMTYVPDFADPTDEAMQTQRADEGLLARIAAGENIGELSEEDLAGTAKTFAPSHQATERSVGGSMATSWAGKSVWNLRIHRRDVLGDLTGIPNEIPRSMQEAQGLSTAFVDDHMVSDYEIVDELGAGNMGVVYEAVQTSLNRDLAIKTLKPKDAKAGSRTNATRQQEYEQEMFVSEAVVTSNLVHPNIVPIHDLARTADGKLFYAMKKVSGTAWNKTIREKGGQEAKLDILMKVCDAVAYAHSRGVINRDLKPENVVVGDYGEVMVLDWGLAVTTDRFDKKSSVLTDVRGGAGTPVYMPPELFDRDISRVGYTSDIYLLGAMLFEILEGFPPHYLRRLWGEERGTNKFNAIVMAVINNEIESDVTECELMNIALKAMATNPADRYQTVEEFQTAVREYRITGRAEELLGTIQTEKPDDYSKHQAAVALFDEASVKWPDNERAAAGGRQARLEYATLAVSKSDLDLASQVVSGQEGDEFDSLRQKITAARRKQTIQKVALVAFMIATVGFGAFSYITKRDLIAKDKRLENVDAEIALAEANRLDAVKQTEAAQAATEMALAEAKRAENDAVIAKAEAEKAQADAAVALTEAEAAKRDAMVAEAAATKATKAAAVAQQEAVKANEDTLKARAETKLAAAEADKAKQAAEKALSEAKLAEAAAAKAKGDLAVAEKAAQAATALAKTAQAEASMAKAEAVKVKQEAEVAVAKLTAESETLGKQIAVAREEQKELQLEVYRSEYRVHKRFIDAYTELGEYGNAVKQIEQALADKDNVEIQRRAANLRRWKDALQRKTGSAEVTLDSPVESSAVSGDGRSVAVFSAAGDGEPKLTVTNTDGTSVIGGVDRELAAFAFSNDGQYLAGVGGTKLQLWKKTASGWLERTPSLPDGVGPLPLLKPLFLEKKRSLLVVSDDRSGAIDAYSTDGDQPQFLSRLELCGKTSANYRLHDLTVDPDAAFLIASTRLQSCRAFPLAWNDGVPSLEKAGPNAPAIRLPIRPQHIVMSNDGRSLAMSEGRDLIVLSRTSAFNPATFPFASAADRRSTVVQGRIVIRDLAFAPDGSRLVAALDEKFIEVWDRQGDRFETSRLDGLYKGQYLAGHSGGVESVAFVGESRDQLVSVGSDDSIRRWDLPNYQGYVDHFEELPGLLTDEVDVPVTRRGVNEIDAIPTIPVSFVDDEQAGRSPPSRVDEIRFRQGRTAFSARFSFDSERIAVGADDRAAHVYDARTGQGTREGSTLGRRSLFFDPQRNAFLEGHIPELSSVQFLPPNGDLLLTEDYFGSISVWDASNDANGFGYEISRLLSEYSLSEFAVSQDGSLVIAGGATIEQVDGGTETQLRHFGLVWTRGDIAASPNPRPRLRLEGEHPRFAITAVAIAPDNSRFATTGRRGRIVIWDGETGQAIAKVASSHGSDQISGVTFLDRRTLLTAGYDGRLQRWTLDGDQLASEEVTRPGDEDRPDFIMRLRPSPDRTRFVTSATVSDRDLETRTSKTRLVISVWERDRPRVLYRELIPEGDPARAFRHDVAWSPDGSKLLLVMDGQLTVYDSSNWQPVLSKSDGGLDSTRAAFKPQVNGGPAKIALFDGEATHLWNLESGDHLVEFRSHAGVFASSFSANRDYVATASDSIRIFDCREDGDQHGKTIARLRPVRPCAVQDVSFRPVAGSTLLASIDKRGILGVWDWSPGRDVPSEPTFVLTDETPAESPGQLAIAWSPGGEAIAAVIRGRVRVWSMVGNAPRELPLPTDAVDEFTANAVAWSADRSRLVAGGVGRFEGGRASEAMGLIWDFDNEGATALTGVFSGGHDFDESAEVTQTGITAIGVEQTGDLLTGGGRGEIIRWGVLDALGVPDGGAALEIESFGDISLQSGDRPHEGPVMSIDVSRNGSVVSAGASGWVVLWPSTF